MKPDFQPRGPVRQFQQEGWRRPDESVLYRPKSSASKSSGTGLQPLDQIPRPPHCVTVSPPLCTAPAAPDYPGKGQTEVRT